MIGHWIGPDALVSGQDAGVGDNVHIMRIIVAERIAIINVLLNRSVNEVTSYVCPDIVLHSNATAALVQIYRNNGHMLRVRVIPGVLNIVASNDRPGLHRERVNTATVSERSVVTHDVIILNHVVA